MAVFRHCLEVKSMPFCYKCGTKLADEAMFCFNCGTKTVSAADNNDMPGNVQSNEKADTTSFPDMSKEESIALLDELALKYGSLERVRKEISELQHSIDSATNYQPKRVSAFSFFWPFMVYSAIAATICVFLAFLLYKLFGFFIFLAFALPIVLTIVGAVRAKNIRNNYINQTAISAYDRRKKKESDEERLSSLVSKERSLRIQLEKHNAIVPVNMRSKSKLIMAKRLLETGKADSFEEAMKLGRT
ncbi:MAG: zinc-ribbon domain-containing protein [Clostridiales bacterium]|nr:zinc-ribbon domain-containing protein [Clostridiales bacterium]